MLDPTIKPTPAMQQDVGNYYKHWTDEWEGCRTLWSETDEFYQQSYSLWPGLSEVERKKRPNYHSSRATNAIDHAVDTQLAFEPSAHRPPTGKSPEHKADADEIENVIVGMLTRTFARHPLHPPKVAGRQLLQYGYTPVGGPFWNTNDEPKRPKKLASESKEDFAARENDWKVMRESITPMEILVPGPTEVLMDYRYTHPALAMHIVTMSKHELMELSKDRVTRKQSEMAWELPKGADEYEEIELLVLWSAYWQSMWTMEQQIHIFTMRNWMGYQPWMHGFAGLGQMPSNREEFDIKFLAKGLLDPIKQGIRLRDQRLSGTHELVMKAAFVKEGTSGDAQDMARQLEESDLLHGQPDSLWWERAPDLPQWAFAEGTEINDDIEQGSFTLALGGFRQQGVSTVGQQLILSGAANKKFAGPIKVIETLFSHVGENMCHLAINVPKNTGRKSLKIAEWELTPTKLHHNTNIQIRFMQVDPVAAIQERNQAMVEFDKGLLDKEGYWSVAGKEDATSIRQRLYEDQVFASERVTALGQAAVLKQFGFRRLAKRMVDEATAGETEEGTIFGPGGKPISTAASRNGGGSFEPKLASRGQALTAGSTSGDAFAPQEPTAEGLVQ